MMSYSFSFTASRGEGSSLLGCFPDEDSLGAMARSSKMGELFFAIMAGAFDGRLGAALELTGGGATGASGSAGMTETETNGSAGARLNDGLGHDRKRAR